MNIKHNKNFDFCNISATITVNLYLRNWTGVEEEHTHHEDNIITGII